MPFSDDEPILITEKSTLKTFILISGISLYFFSLFSNCFCTANNCMTSFQALALGWFDIFIGGAAGTAASWFGNPFLILSWFLLAKNNNWAWIVAMVASFLSLLFLKSEVIIENEAGYITPIIKIGLGYWLWLSSCLTTLVGSLTIRIIKFKKSQPIKFSY